MDIFKKIPGFRSGKKKNKIIASIYYGFILLSIISVFKEVDLLSMVLAWLTYPFIVFGIIDIIKNKKKIRNKYFLAKVAAPFVIMILLTSVALSSDTSYEDTNIAQNETQLTTEKEVETDSIIDSATSDEEKNEKEENKDNEKVESNPVIENKDSEIHFINTGNSDAILIKQGDKAALIDGGDNDDETRVVSYLKDQGIKELEYIFATHPHADHIGGLDAVINSIPVKNVYVSNGDSDTKTYSDFINAIANKGLNPSVPLLNSEFKLGTSKFKVLSVANSNEPNNTSIVLLYTNGEDEVLLMGDAEAEIEAKINVENIDLLKVGHHGSNSSSTTSFINKTNPKYAVITAGVNNKYGHPHIETMNTLKNNSIEVHRSDECGDIVFKSSGSGLSVDCKDASYNPGNKKESVSTSSNVSSGSNSGSSSSSNTNTVVAPKPQVQQPVTPPASNTGSNIVYWTPNGKSYHTTKSCSTLSRSKTIYSGTIQESGKYDPCDRCH